MYTTARLDEPKAGWEANHRATEWKVGSRVPVAGSSSGLPSLTPLLIIVKASAHPFTKKTPFSYFYSGETTRTLLFHGAIKLNECDGRRQSENDPFHVTRAVRVTVNVRALTSAASIETHVKKNIQIKTRCFVMSCWTSASVMLTRAMTTVDISYSMLSAPEMKSHSFL